MQGILFDLDGTLLDIDLEAFLGRYFASLKTAMASILPDGMTGQDALRALGASTQAMMEPHPGVTNRVVFHDDFRRRTGIDLDTGWALFERFYAEDFPGLRGSSGPRAGAREVVEAAVEAGFKVAVATNPIFPSAAIRHRIGWADLDDVAFDVVTTYEQMLACKPHPEYFRQTAALLGVPAERCMMVGDDRFLDLAAADVGMRTFYVGPHQDAHADFRGTLRDLMGLLPRLGHE